MVLTNERTPLASSFLTMGAAPFFWAALIAAVHFGLQEGPLVPRVPPEGISLLWLPNAFLAAALACCGFQRRTFAMFVGAALFGSVAFSVIVRQEPIWFAWPLILLNLAEASAIAFLLRRLGDGDGRLDSPKAIFVFFAAALSAPFLTALPAPLFGGAVFGVDEVGLGIGVPIWRDPEYWRAVRIWWLGNATAYSVLGAPLIVWATMPDAVRGLRAHLVEFLVLTLAVAAGVFLLSGGWEWTAGMLGSSDGQHLIPNPAYLFLTLPVLNWLAFRLGLPAATAAVSVSHGPAILLTSVGYGPFAMDGVHAQAFTLQIYANVTTSAVLLLAALAHGLERRRELLQHRNQELDAARDVAERANLAKANFLAVMSHELRTPLHQVLMALDLVKQERLSPNQRELSDLAQNAARALLEGMDDILEYAENVDDRPQARRAAFAPAEPIATLEKRYRPLAKDKGLGWSVEADVPEDVHVLSDKDRVTRILRHFVDNAVKYTESGYVQIRVRATLDPSGCHILRYEVDDTGPGLSADSKAQIFEPFSQLSEGVNRHFQGLGIGLAVAKSMVSALQGRIGVEANEPKGSLFWFEVPVETVAKARTPHAVGKRTRAA